MPAKTLLTVADAAKRVGKSRQTLFEKIKRGQLSATTNVEGNKVVDVSELLRVFGALLSDDEVKQNQVNRSGQSSVIPLTSALQTELALAKLQLTHAEKELATANKQLEEMKVRERQSIEDRTQLLGVIERQTLLLAAPKPAPAPRVKAVPKPAPAPAKAPTRAKAAPAPAKPKAAPEKAVAKAPARPKSTATRSKPVAAKKATQK